MIFSNLTKSFLLFFATAMLTVNAAVFDIDFTLSSTAPLNSQLTPLVSPAVSFWESKITSRYVDNFLYKPLGPLHLTISGANLGSGILGYANVTDHIWTSVSGGPYPTGRIFDYPVEGYVVLNTAFPKPITDTVWTQIIEHEIAHTLGFGMMWQSDHIYIDGSGKYTGPEGVKAYQREFGVSLDYVPVELDFGPGSANVHWEETGVMDYELMGARTSISKGTWLSDTTIASMRDLGYNTIALRTDIPEPATIFGVLTPVGLFFFARRRL